MRSDRKYFLWVANVAMQFDKNKNKKTSNLFEYNKAMMILVTVPIRIERFDVNNRPNMIVDIGIGIKNNKFK